MHRRERFGLQELAAWPQGSAAGQAAGLRCLRDLHAALRPHVPGFADQNYIDPELSTWRRAAEHRKLGLPA